MRGVLGAPGGGRLEGRGPPEGGVGSADRRGERRELREGDPRSHLALQELEEDQVHAYPSHADETAFPPLLYEPEPSENRQGDDSCREPGNRCVACRAGGTPRGRDARRLRCRSPGSTGGGRSSRRGSRPCATSSPARAGRPARCTPPSPGRRPTGRGAPRLGTLGACGGPSGPGPSARRPNEGTPPAPWPSDGRGSSVGGRGGLGSKGGAG